MSLIKKLKIKFDFTSIQVFSSISAQLSFAENHFILKITDNDTFTNKTKKKEIIKTLFKPIFQEEDNIYINYALIHKIHNLSNIKLKIEIFHPNKPELITIEFYNIIEPGIFRNKKLNTDQMSDIETFLQNKNVQGSKRMIEIIDNFLYCLKDGMTNEGIVSNLEDKFYDSMADSKKYYQKAINDLKKKDQIKLDMKRKIFEKEKKNKQQGKCPNLIGNNSHIKNNSMNLDNSIYQTKSIFNSFNECDINNIVDTIIDEDDDDKNYSSYESIFFELKKNSIHFLESTILLFFQILELEKHLLDLNSVNKYKVSKGLKMVKQYESISNSNVINKKMSNSSLKMSESSNNSNDKNNIIKLKNYYSENVKSSNKQIVFNSNYTNNQVIINMNLCNEDRKIDNKNIKINNNEEGIIIQITLEDTKDNKFDTLLKNENSIYLSSPEKSKSNLKKIVKKNQNLEEETPKFFIKPIPQLEPLKNSNNSKNVKNINREPQIKQETQMIIELKKRIEEIKKNHMFFPPNDYMNIIHNTTEISHRIFYQKCFDDYFNKVFNYENDRFGFIKIESIISFFYYIKGLKNFLFNDANKIFYANMIFYEDD